MNKKKICVLGATGYLGKSLVKALLQEEANEVIAVHRATSDIAELAQIAAHTPLMLCNQDTQKLDLQGVDCVVNCVCRYETAQSTTMDILQANLTYPMEWLEAAIAAGVPEFIGINTSLPPEVNAYALSKTQFHAWGKYKSQKGCIQFTNVLLENYYGAGEPANRFLPSVIQKMKENQDVPLTLGRQHRDFVSIEDVVAVLQRIIHKTDKPQYYQVPLGTGEAPMVCEVVEYLHQVLHSQSKLCFGAVPMRKNEPDCVADTSVLTEMGYEIQYNWKAGLKKLLEGNA